MLNDVRDHWEYIIIGGGPAGLQLAYYLSKAQRDYVVLEQADDVGAFFRTFPRHGRLISINKVYTGYEDPEINLRWDWNSLLTSSRDPTALFSGFSTEYFPPKDAMTRYLAYFAEHHRLNVITSANVEKVYRRSGFRLQLTGRDRELSCRCLIIATGLKEPHVPDIDGAHLCSVYQDMSLDYGKYRNKRVLVVGKGNSGFETAEHLVPVAALIHVCSPTPLRMAWETHFVGHLRAVNNNLIDTYQLKSQNAVMDADVRSIRRDEDQFVVTFAYKHAEGEVETINYDEVILCTGFRMDTELFGEDCLPDRIIHGRLPRLTAEWESSNIGDMYFAGSLMQSLDYQRYMSGFIHGFRYNVRTLFHLLMEKNHGVPYPNRMHSADEVVLVDVLLSRMNRSSALWQQPGFLIDAFEFEGRQVRHYRELTPDLCHARVGARSGTYLTLSLEYGRSRGPSVLAEARIARTNTEAAGQSAFLHPVVRWFHRGRLIREHHVIEDLFAEWQEPEHTQPLQQFVGLVISVLESPAAAP